MTDTQLVKKLKFKQVRIPFPQFAYTLNVVMGDIKNLQEYIRWKFNDDNFTLVNMTKLGFTIVREGYCPILWLPRQPKTPQEIGTLAHEATHVVVHLFDYIGATWNQHTEELGAYATGYITQEVLKCR